MYKCSRKVRNAPNGAIGSPSPSPSLGLLNLLNAMNSELERDEAEVPHEVVTTGTDTGGVNWVDSHPPLALKLNFCFILLKE